VPIARSNINNNNCTIRRTRGSESYSDKNELVLKTGFRRPPERRSVDFLGDMMSTQKLTFNLSTAIVFVAIFLTICLSSGHAGDISGVHRQNELPQRDNPEVRVDPNGIEAELDPGEIFEVPFRIHNEGDEDLEFSISHEFIEDDELQPPFRDDPGQVLQTFEIPYHNVEDITWDGSYIWGVGRPDDRRINVIWALDPLSGEIVEEFETEHWNWNIGYSGDYFWITNHRDRFVFIYDRSGSLIDQIPLYLDPGRIGGIFADGNGKMIIFNQSEPGVRGYRITVYDSDTYEWISQSNVELEFENFYQIEEMKWAPEHGEGHLWLKYRDYLEINFYITRVSQFSVDEDWNVSFTGNSFIPEFSESCFVHNGRNLWLISTQDFNELLVIDDGITENWWINYNPDEGIVAPGESSEILVEIGISGMPDGNYEASLLIATNDPDDELEEIFILLSISEGIAVTSEPLAFPLDDAVPLAFPTTVVWDDVESRIPVYVYNSGNRDLTIESFELTGANVECYSVSIPQEAVTISPNIRKKVDIFFHPTGLAARTARLTFNTNAENVDGGRIWFDLTGIGIRNPEITVNPDDDLIRIELEDFELESDRSFEIGWLGDENTGDLHYSIQARPKAPQYLENSFSQIDFQLGQRIAGYAIPYRCSGLVWDGVKICGISQDDARFYALDPATGELTFDRHLDFRPSLIMLINEQLWLGETGNSVIRVYDLDGRSIGRFDLPWEINDRIFSDNKNYFFRYDNSFRDLSIDVLDINSYEEIATIQFESSRNNSYTWTYSNENGQVWVSNENSIRQIIVNENWEVTSVNYSYTNLYTLRSGLCHDGRNLWCGSGSYDSLWVIGDGIVEELSWVDINPADGVLSHDDNNRIINLSFNAEDLVEFTEYSGILNIISNDLGNPLTSINLTLQTGALDVQYSENLTPQIYYLLAPYPNPFNSRTRISYGLANSGEVSINVYNLAGQQVQNLMNQQQTPGNHSVTWDASGFPSGMYLIRMSCNNQEFIQKMMCLE